MCAMMMIVKIKGNGEGERFLGVSKCVAMEKYVGVDVFFFLFFFTYCLCHL